MKHIISDRDVQHGFLRCACDTKYDCSVYDLLAAHGCRVCGDEFQRVTDAEIAARLAEITPLLSPETVTFIAMLFKQK